MGIIQRIKDIKLQQDECISSYDEKALLTSVLIGPAITIIKEKLEKDKELSTRKNMFIGSIISLLELC